MNGRIYDPDLGRFLQPDPVIQAPNNAQSWNAYTYVFNNPLRYTDPTGMIGIAERQWAATAFAIVYTYFTWDLQGGAAIAAAAAGGFVSGSIATGSWDGGIRGAFTAGLTAGIGMGVAGYGNGIRVGAMAMTGGVLEYVQGGSFGHAFVTAGLTAAVMPGVRGIRNDFARITVGALVGGTLSEMTGGKFANGAVTGAIQVAMNGQASDGAALHSGDGLAQADPKKAVELIRSADKALAAAGFYKRVASGYYRSERAIARAWGEIVAPIANAIGAEAGAWISKLPNGAYVVGGVFSVGAFDWVPASGASVSKYGEDVAFVHTHPFVDGGQFLSNQYGVGGINSLGDTIHPGEGDMSWAIINRRNIYSFGGPRPMLRGFNPASWERQQIPGGGLQQMCQFTTPAGCP